MNMFGGKFSERQTDMMLKMASQKLQKNPGDIKAAIESGDVSSLTQSLGENERKKVNAVLSDPEAMNRILSDPKVQELLKSFDKGR